MDLALLLEIQRKNQGLQEAHGSLEKLKGVLDKLTASPWHAAVFFCGFETAEGPRAMVYQGGGRRVVGLAEGLELESLQPGDEVFLTHEMNAIIEKSPFGVPQVGETACFSRYTGGGRLVVQCRDEELIIHAAGALGDVELKAGDEVRWDKSTWMAYEKIERAAGRRYFLDDVPDVRPEQVGGQGANLRTLLGALKAKLVSPELAKTYELDGQESILLIGPPGCGKTLMARVAAAEIARTSGRKCRFAVVKPGEFEDPYVGVTQRNIRNCFESLREAAEDGFAVLFFDEIETIGRLRGSAVGHHSDKFLGALLAEIDGFKDRSGVAIIAATNRKDLCDPALLE
ncbi:MAG TPA: AAA family ATPase, partial [Polyangia bacterium]|nr:AAA family ATPase [Polyangia bacterium]